MTPMQRAAEVWAHLYRLHEAVWESAAIAVALGDGSTIDPVRRSAAERVLVETGLLVTTENGVGASPGLQEVIGRGGAVAADAASDIRQSAALLAGAAGWVERDAAALLVQGPASAQLAEPFKTFVVPMLDGLDALLSGPSPLMLDVGVGVGGLAAAFCTTFPGLRIVGLDVLAGALELARRQLDEAGLGDRVDLRLQDVAELADEPRYCLAWLPAPFLPHAALEVGVPRVAAALVPGGWLVLGHGKLSRAGLAEAVARLQAVAFGGSALDDSEAQDLLRRAGLERVATLATPADAPALTVGRRPSAGDAGRGQPNCQPLVSSDPPGRAFPGDPVL